MLQYVERVVEVVQWHSQLLPMVAPSHSTPLKTSSQNTILPIDTHASCAQNIDEAAQRAEDERVNNAKTLAEILVRAS